ncbi:MAG: 3-methyl-2-oxobutanoate hydroxymethyltransferase [Gammaproteobacteria bacterium]|nr:3-methyl-2-oxobutanoate hydroxymethyltransferase [Gammaproteobacteria bacterium]MCW8986341.1 3-methyl-2-oxobutanoate hydroxymethyltransferase [Gammaproteobacteria bacterium]MCW9032145.1 3-methyl-2-oxobutanoate hydroxymethyltransferase [Gammaproteobacteria bacterium]
MSLMTVKYLQELKDRNEKITVLTAYDASFTKHLEQAGIEVILVGDSLGMVVQGHDSTVPVTVDDMVYHTSMVSRVRERALLIADMPYHSYQNKDQALENAKRLMDEAGADMVKFEGAGELVAIAEHLIKNNIPVCGHLGLLPQSVEELGGYKVQGREQTAADKMIEDAQALVDVGVEIIVLECIPQILAKRITTEVDVITIGIGAGVDVSGQVLVLYDLLGITPGKRPKFSKDFLKELGQGKSVTDAIANYVKAVKDLSFPAQEHSFN